MAIDKHQALPSGKAIKHPATLPGYSNHSVLPAQGHIIGGLITASRMQLTYLFVKHAVLPYA